MTIINNLQLNTSDFTRNVPGMDPVPCIRCECLGPKPFIQATFRDRLRESVNGLKIRTKESA